jgi:hypothetical protein
MVPPHYTRRPGRHRSSRLQLNPTMASCEAGKQPVANIATAASALPPPHQQPHQLLQPLTTTHMHSIALVQADRRFKDQHGDITSRLSNAPHTHQNVLLRRRFRFGFQPVDDNHSATAEREKRRTNVGHNARNVEKDDAQWQVSTSRQRLSDNGTGGSDQPVSAERFCTKPSTSSSLETRLLGLVIRGLRERAVDAVIPINGSTDLRRNVVSWFIGCRSRPSAVEIRRACDVTKCSFTGVDRVAATTDDII